MSFLKAPPYKSHQLQLMSHLAAFNRETKDKHSSLCQTPQLDTSPFSLRSYVIRVLVLVILPKLHDKCMYMFDIHKKYIGDSKVIYTKKTKIERNYFSLSQSQSRGEVIWLLGKGICNMKPPTPKMAMIPPRPAHCKLNTNTRKYQIKRLTIP